MCNVALQFSPQHIQNTILVDSGYIAYHSDSNFSQEYSTPRRPNKFDALAIGKHLLTLLAGSKHISLGVDPLRAVLQLAYCLYKLGLVQEPAQAQVEHFMEQRINRVVGPMQGITEEIDLAFMGDALSDKAAASIEARWHAGIEDTVEDVDLNWYGKLVRMFFNKLRNMCL